MRISKLLQVLYILSVILFLSGCEPDNPTHTNIIAEYDNNYKVTIEELHKYVKDWLYFKKFNVKAEAYNNALNDLLVNQFKRMEFFELGLDKDSILIKNINRIINEELVAEYFKSQYVTKYANEETAKKMYSLMDKEVIYQLISLRKPENATKMQLDSLQEKALQIKSEIENGNDIIQLVQKYSQNEISLANNGFMPPLDWKKIINNPVSDIIFKLNKNDVRVLNTNDEYIIVKVNDIVKINIEPFDSIKSNIIHELKKGFADRSVDDYEKDKKNLIDAKSIKWNDEALNQILSWSNLRNFYEGSEYKRIIKNTLENGNNKIILSYNATNLDYREFLRLLDDVLVMRYFEGIKKEDVKKFIIEVISTDLIIKKANDLDLKQNIFNPFTKNPALRHQIANLYNQVEIEARIPEITEEALLQFFKKNEKNLYYQPEKVNLFVMVFPSEKEAEAVSDKIKSGTPFEKVTGNYFVKTYIKGLDGEIKSFLSQEKPEFGKIAFEMKKSEVSDPIKYESENGEEKFAILKNYHFRPEKQLTFSDVSNTISDDFKNYHRKNIEKEVEDKLKSKYKPIIYKDVLEKITSVN